MINTHTFHVFKAASTLVSLPHSLDRFIKFYRYSDGLAFARSIPERTILKLIFDETSQKIG